MAKFNRLDLEHILRQIFMAEEGQDPLSPHLAFGLRRVSGIQNNTVPGNALFGSADQLFPRLTQPVFQSAEIKPVDFFGPGDPAGAAPTSYAQSTGYVIDSAPRTISNLISDQTANNPAALEAQAASTPGTGYLYSHRSPLNPAFNSALPEGPDNPRFIAPTANPALPADVDAAGNLFIANVTPDAGLSAPFNSWLTFFGQFFDHGLDKVTNGGNGTVYIPLKADDPLMLLGADGIADTGDELSRPEFAGQRFMAMTRATQFQGPGADGVLGTADDTFHEAKNTITPFVDQNQTYSSHPSHQVFLRAYLMDANGKPQATGKLITNRDLGADHKFDTAPGGDDTELGGMATWAVVKAQASAMLGLNLTDADVGNVPLLRTDEYGMFIRGPNGFAQVITGAGADGLFNTADDIVIEGDPTANGGLGIDLTNAVRTGHAFLNDIAHAAAPVFSAPGVLAPDGDTVAGNAVPNDGLGHNTAYDNELLDAHYIAGDGRVNENIGLTSVHAIFHSEHNRQIELIKDMVRTELANGDSSFASDWVLPTANLADGIQDNEWNGERLFQAAKFATETQYQHIVFEEFARKVAPTIHLFGNNDIHLDPAITAEFAHAVYRFGHSMLDENVNRYVLHGQFLADGVTPDPLAGTPVLDANGDPVMNEIGLISAFLNPLEFAARGSDAAAEIILGSVNQVGNEIDEFVTGALRNNLVGLPLDLAAINIARGRDTGVPPLNLLRNQLFTATNDQTLKPYASWDEFGQFLKHPASLVNFVAAYGTHASIVNATTLADKRTAAQALVDGAKLDPSTGLPVDQAAYEFMHSLGSFANNAADPRAIHDSAGLPPQWSTGSVTGLDQVDLWIGGLAEKQNLFGGLLGSTFNFIFETQLEALQDADRLYYLPRVEGMQWGQQIENNSFAELIMLNTNLKHLSASIFLTPEYVVEASTVTNDPSTWLRNPLTGALLVEKLPDGTVHFIGDDNFFGNTMVLGGTAGDDRLQAGHADDDTVWGDAGNDWLDGGNGNDFIYGGTGNDTVRDSGGDDVIHGDEGDDDLDGGIGDDIIFGNDGNDLIHGGNSILGDAIQGGLGNDILFGDEGDDELLGNEGDDWIEGGTGADILVGDTGAPTGQVPLYAGNDVLDGGEQGDKMVGFSGDDIMLGLGGFDKFNGLLGFDWASFEKETHGVSVDMDRREFIPNQQQNAGDAVRDFFVETEATSGSAYDDFIQGSEDTGAAAGVFNELTNVDLIFGLASFFPVGPVSFSNANILLGGDGSDTITGRAGNDIIDGDAWLHVELSRDAQGNIRQGADIIREIRYDITDGDVDTAVYRDVAANYIISAAPDAQGFYTVTHVTLTPGVVGLTNDGVDRIRNIERLQFADQTIIIDPNPGANGLPTGGLTITGDTNAAVAGVDPAIGSPLGVTSTIADPDGIASPIAYQWQYLDLVPANGGASTWVNITAATDPTFTPTNLFLGQQLRVVATFTDGRGLVEHVNSAPTNIVAAPAGINTAPFINQQQNPPGLPDTSARTNQAINLVLPLLTVFNDAQTAANLLTYTATLADGSALATEGLTFTTVPDLVNGGVLYALITGSISHTGPVSVRVTATDAGPGTPLSVTDTFIINVTQGNRAPLTAADSVFNGATEDAAFSATLPAGVDPDGTVPVFRLVAGSAVNGTVTAFNQTTGAFTFVGAADFAGAATFAYTLFDGQASSGQTTVTVNIAGADDGAAPINITGTAAVGQTLSGLIGVDPDGPWDPGTATYQWFRDNVAISAPVTADPNYTVQAADVGHSLKVVATYVDGQGFATTLTSPPTDPIGVLAIRAFGGVSTATVSVFNSLSDPDGNPTPDTTFYTWETSADGTTWTDANPAEVSLDGLSLAQAPSASATPSARFVRVTTTYIDAAGNLDTATSEAVRVLTGRDSNTLGDTMTGGSGTDIFFGLRGADNISTGGGNDILVGGLGNDTLNGGTGDDTFVYTIGDGADTVLGGAGADTLSIHGLAAADTLDVTFNGTRLTVFEGGTLDAAVESVVADLAGGANSLVYTSTGGVTVDLLAGTASGFTRITNIANVTGGGGADVLTGDGDANALDGAGGADTISGGGGADTITGGAGNDTLNGGAGNDTFLYQIGDGADTVVGGAGANDTLAISTAAGAQTLTVGYDGTRITTFEGGSVDATVESITANLGGGADTLTYTSATGVTVNLATSTATGFTSIANIEDVNGGTGDDTLTGDGAANTLNGNNGADILNGAGGGDTLNGGGGADTLDGGNGGDVLNGGAGGDILIGGAGADTVSTGAANDDVTDHVRYSLATDYGDTVTNFDATGTAAQVDMVEFGGALNTLFDDIANDDNIQFGQSGAGNNANTAVNMNTQFEALILSGAAGKGVTSANIANAAAVATEFNSEFGITAANGEESLLVINATDGSGQFSVWQWVQALGGEVTAAELTLVGVFSANAVVSTTNFDFIAA